MGATICRIVVGGDTIEEIVSFDYISDVMAIAEEAHLTVDNKGKKYRDKLQIGDRVEFILQNKAVNGDRAGSRRHTIVPRRLGHPGDDVGSGVAPTELQHARLDTTARQDLCRHLRPGDLAILRQVMGLQGLALRRRCEA